jgi:hypothetical protein
MSTELAGCSVGPGISRGARKLARTLWVINKKKEEEIIKKKSIYTLLLKKKKNMRRCS